MCLALSIGYEVNAASEATEVIAKHSVECEASEATGGVHVPEASEASKTTFKMNICDFH